MAFLQDTPAREPFLKAPLSVISLIGVIVAAHIARVFAPSAMSDAILTDFALIPSRYSSSASGNGEILGRVVPFISHMFLHVSATHLIINCLWLLAFGTVVARRFRAALFFLFYFVCGLAAAVVHLLCNWGSPDAAMGASGAIAGLMAAGVRMLRAQTSRDGEVSNALLPILSPQVATFSAFWVAMNLIFGLTGAALLGVPGLVAWQAHLGGYFAGLFLAGPFDRWARKSDPKLPLPS